MSKYSYQFKLKIVLEYLNGTLGYNKLAKKYGLSDSILVRRWVNQYKTYGIEGLQTKERINILYLFKLDVLKFKQDTGASYTIPHSLANTIWLFVCPIRIWVSRERIEGRDHSLRCPGRLVN